MSFTIRQLQFFVAVAKQGSVSGAARALSISQSSVTEALKALEADLGVTLFERRARGLEITHKGSLFLRHATEILRGVGNARIAFREEDRPPGRLALGVTSLVAGYVLSDILARFRRAHPEVEVRAIEDNGDYLQHLLIGGEFDVAVLLTSSIRDRAALQVETLQVSPYRLWLPLGHPLAAVEAIGLDQVVGERLIMPTVDEIEEATARLVALLPDLVYRPWSLEGDRIEIRDVSGDLPAVHVGLAWRRGAPLSGPGRDFERSAQTAMSLR